MKKVLKPVEADIPKDVDRAAMWRDEPPPFDDGRTMKAALEDNKELADYLSTLVIRIGPLSFR